MLCVLIEFILYAQEEELDAFAKYAPHACSIAYLPMEMDMQRVLKVLGYAAMSLIA